MAGGVALGAVALALLWAVGLQGVDGPAVAAVERALGQGGAARSHEEARALALDDALEGRGGPVARALAERVTAGDREGGDDPDGRAPRDRVRVYDGGAACRAVWSVRAVSDPSGAERGLELVWVDVSAAFGAHCRDVAAAGALWAGLSVAAWLSCRRLCVAIDGEADRQRLFYALAAHDIKGPLMAVDAAVDVGATGTGAGREAAERVHRATARVRERADRLLQVAWAEDGALESDPHRLDVREMAFDAAADRGLPLGHVDLPVPLAVLADPDLSDAAVGAVLSAASDDAVVTGAFRFRGACRPEAGLRVDDAGLVAVEEDGPASGVTAIRLARRLMELQEGELEADGAGVSLWWPAQE